MGFFRLPRFIRRFIRRHTKPIPEHRATSIKSKLSLAYAFVAWNIFGLVLWQTFYSDEKKHTKEEVMNQKWWVGKVYNIDSSKYYKTSPSRGIVETSKEEKSEQF